MSLANPNCYYVYIPRHPHWGKEPHHVTIDINTDIDIDIDRDIDIDIDMDIDIDIDIDIYICVCVVCCVDVYPHIDRGEHVCVL